jgi:GGDEF domain-containing protein
VRPLSDVRPAKESLHTPEMRKQRLRLKRFSMAAATYTFVTLVGLGLSRWSASRLPGGALAAYIGLAVAINAIWFTVFITGANLRFREPSLTAAQIVVSALWGTIPLYYLSADRGLVLLCYLPAFSFGILALSFRAYFAVTAAVLAAYVGVLALQYRELGSRMVWQQELLTFGVFAAVLFWFASFGGYVHRMRRRLRRDNEALDLARRRLLSLSRTDPLTALSNRSELREKLELFFAAPTSGRPAACAAIIDIDHFKRINDIHGHLVGDDVLRGFARILRDLLRGPDLVVRVAPLPDPSPAGTTLIRFGGDEFVVLLESVTPEAAVAVLERLRSALEQTGFEAPTSSIRVTCSIGATWARDDDTGDAVLKRADEALYRAKEEGRNRIVWLP